MYSVLLLSYCKRLGKWGFVASLITALPGPPTSCDSAALRDDEPDEIVYCKFPNYRSVASFLLTSSPYISSPLKGGRSYETHDILESPHPAKSGDESDGDSRACI